ncbi:MAG: MBL fold metallo-hydrolase [Acidimicrobiia bacterium]
MTTLNVGDYQIVPIIDGVLHSSIDSFLGKGSKPEDWRGTSTSLRTDNTVELALGGFLVRGPGDRVVLIDAGLGPLQRPGMNGGLMLDNLRAAGVETGDVTDVLFTHLHFDHVGWATQKGNVVFENATYRCDARDWDWFVGPDEGATRKLNPLRDRIETWDGPGTVLPGIDIQMAPGHTPGSTVIVVSHKTDRAVLLGDVVHCPAELIDDEWGTMGDVDPELARRTRAALNRELEGSTAHVVAAHFPGLEFGRLLGGQGKRQWVV